MRIVSLLPSATEIVCAAGAGDELVGVSHECDYPPAVRSLPKLTRPKIRVDTPSATIDRDVRELLAQGLGVYEIDVDALRALAPDVIVTQQHCEVCAVSFADVAAAVRAVLTTEPTIVSLTPCTLDDVWRDVQRVADAIGRSAAGTTVVDGARARLDDLRRRIVGRGRPVVACIEWLDPVMTGGNWIPELVAIAGGAYPFATAGSPSAATTWSAVADADPDAIVLMPCGFHIPQTRRELPTLTARREWRTLRAVRAGRAAVVDGNAYFNRPGPRLVESAEILAGILHPDAGVAPPPGAVVALTPSNDRQ